MDSWVPIVALVLGFVLRGEFVRFTERGRLPDRIDRHLAILDRLPAGETRDQLLEHIERETRYLVAHEDLSTVRERLDLRWGLGYIALGICFPLIALTERWSGVLLVVAIVGAAAMVAAGIYMLMRARGERSQRRWARLSAAEKGDRKKGTDPPAGA